MCDLISGWNVLGNCQGREVIKTMLTSHTGNVYVIWFVFNASFFCAERNVFIIDFIYFRTRVAAF